MEKVRKLSTEKRPSSRDQSPSTINLPDPNSQVNKSPKPFRRQIASSINEQFLPEPSPLLFDQKEEITWKSVSPLRNNSRSRSRTRPHHKSSIIKISNSRGNSLERVLDEKTPVNGQIITAVVTSPKNEEPQQNRGRSKFLEPSTLERRRKNNPTNNNPPKKSRSRSKSPSKHRYGGQISPGRSTPRGSLHCARKCAEQINIHSGYTTPDSINSRSSSKTRINREKQQNLEKVEKVNFIQKEVNFDTDREILQSSCVFETDTEIQKESNNNNNKYSANPPSLPIDTLPTDLKSTIENQIAEVQKQAIQNQQNNNLPPKITVNSPPQTNSTEKISVVPNEVDPLLSSQSSFQVATINFEDTYPEDDSELTPIPSPVVDVLPCIEERSEPSSSKYHTPAATLTRPKKGKSNQVLEDHIEEILTDVEVNLKEKSFTNLADFNNFGTANSSVINLVDPSDRENKAVVTGCESVATMDLLKNEMKNSIFKPKITAHKKRL